MNKLGMIGGIGQGVMQGLQFMRQLDADKRADQALQNQSEFLGMQRDVHREKMGEFNRANEERQRTDLLNTLSTRIDEVHKDLPAHERKQMFLEMGTAMGQMKPADIEMVTKARDALVDKFGETAVTALAAGNIGPMQSVLKTQNIDLQADPKTGKYLVKLPGATEPVSLDQKGIFGMDVLSGYRKRKMDLEKAALDARKTEAEIGKINEQAGYYSRIPQDKVSLGIGGAGGTGKGGKKDTDPADMFSADYFLERFGVGKDSDKELRARGDNAYGYYQMLHKSNPAIFSTVDGNERAFRLARDIDNGTVQREVKFDPSTMRWIRYVTDTQGGRYQLDPGAIEPREYKGPDGKPALEPSVIEQSEVSALQNLAKSKPDQYRLAMQLSQAKELTNDELLAASEGKPITSGGKEATISPMLANTALMIRRRGVEQPKRITTPGGIPRKPLPDTSGYGAGGSKGTSLAGEVFDEYVADPVAKFFKDSAAKARAE